MDKRPTFVVSLIFFPKRRSYQASARYDMYVNFSNGFVPTVSIASCLKPTNAFFLCLCAVQSCDSTIFRPTFAHTSFLYKIQFFKHVAIVVQNVSSLLGREATRLKQQQTNQFCTSCEVQSVLNPTVTLTFLYNVSLNSRGSFENKLFVVEAWSLLNLTYGTRLEAKKKGLPYPPVQQRRSSQPLEGGPADYKPRGGSRYSQESLGSWQSPINISSPERRQSNGYTKQSPRDRFPSPRNSRFSAQSQFSPPGNSPQ